MSKPKLTNEELLKIKKLKNDGIRIEDLSKRFYVGMSTIYRVLKDLEKEDDSRSAI